MLADVRIVFESSQSMIQREHPTADSSLIRRAAIASFNGFPMRTRQTVRQNNLMHVGAPNRACAKIRARGAEGQTVI